MQSFMWADKLKDEGAKAEAQEAADRFTNAMTTEPDVLLEQVFAARQGESPLPPASGHASAPETIRSLTQRTCVYKVFLGCWIWKLEVCKLRECEENIMQDLVKMCVSNG